MKLLSGLEKIFETVNLQMLFGATLSERWKLAKKNFFLDHLEQAFLHQIHKRILLINLV